MAWYGTCWNINVNVNRHCIKQVALAQLKDLAVVTGVVALCLVNGIQEAQQYRQNGNMVYI